jgi:hypothetical protein
MRIQNVCFFLIIGTMALTFAGPSQAQTDTMFRDVPKNHWAYEAVKSLKEKGIVQGYPAEPKQGKSRSTTTTVFNAPSPDLQDAFKDLPADHWAYASLTYLQKQGILEGYPDRYFRGKRTLTRYEFAIAIRRLIDRGLLGTAITPGRDDVPAKTLTL